MTENISIFITDELYTVVNESRNNRLLLIHFKRILEHLQKCQGDFKITPYEVRKLQKLEDTVNYERRLYERMIVKDESDLCKTKIVLKAILIMILAHAFLFGFYNVVDQEIPFWVNYSFSGGTMMFIYFILTICSVCYAFNDTETVRRLRYDPTVYSKEREEEWKTMTCADFTRRQLELVDILSKHVEPSRQRLVHIANQEKILGFLSSFLLFIYFLIRSYYSFKIVQYADQPPTVDLNFLSFSFLLFFSVFGMVVLFFDYVEYNNL